MTKYSVLDLVPILEGGDAAQAFRNARSLARHAESLGYTRYWMSEHHSMPGLASAATAVVLGHVAEATTTIRVGAGGIMLPNHSPLQVTEQFGTLDAMYPGRIDLGLGRAPGTDQAAAYAMRRNMTADAAQFPRDVVELMTYFEAHDGVRRVRAIPGEGADVHVWILGSSTFGAELAAMLGLPYAFASHFAPAQMMEAIGVYRRNFRPSARLAAPYLMLGFNVFAGESDEEGALLATSMQQAFVSLRTGTPGKLKPPVTGYLESLPPPQRAMLDGVLSASGIGSPSTVKAAIAAFVARTGADELMIAGQIFDHGARLRSYEIAADCLADVRVSRAA